MSKSDEYICPNCFRRCQKDASMRFITSGVVTQGWHGNLEEEMHKVKPVVNCPRCDRPINLHALLRGRFDENYTDFRGGSAAFLLGGAYLIWGLDFPWWQAVPMAAAFGFVVGFVLRGLISVWMMLGRLPSA